MTKPEPEEFEITVFGPGFGECIVIHVGDGKWLIIDSCLDDNDQPAAVSYLKYLGVDVTKDVDFVSATHWHDDHVKGLSKALDECKSAKLGVAVALSRSEFVAFLQVHDDQPVTKIDRGGTELLRCLQIAGDSGRKVKPLIEDTIVVDYDDEHFAHGQRVELRALSPSSTQYTDFLKRIADFPAENLGKAKTRIVEPGRNDLSIAMLLTIGEQSILLGADLEESAHADKGWNAVIAQRKGRRPLAHIHKIPHHGSKGAHNDVVWSELLAGETVSVITPWQLGGGKLPKDDDICRIKALSEAAYLTSTKRRSLKKTVSKEVLKHIKSSGVDFDTVVFSGGRVTLRWTASDDTPNVTLINGARKV